MVLNYMKQFVLKVRITKLIFKSKEVFKHYIELSNL